MKNVWILLILCVGFRLPGQELTPDARKAWTASGKSITGVLDLESRRGDLPESRWIGKDQKRLDREISRLLEDVVSHLQVTGLGEARERFQELENRESARREELRQVREKAALAPAEVSVLEFYRKDRETYLQEAEALEEELIRLAEKKNGLINEMTEAARASELNVDADQMRFLLSSVSGAELLDLAGVFQNVREINLMLEGLVRDNPGDTEAARRYYGMHVVLLRTLVQAHDDVLLRLDDRYLPRVQELQDENEALQKETEDLLRFAQTAQRELLLSSRNTQRVTREALELYHEHLQSVRDRVYDARKELQQRSDVAWNAYRTIRIAATLAEEMSHAVQDLQTLRSLEAPELLPLQDEALKERFMKLSEQFKQ